MFSSLRRLFSSLAFDAGIASDRTVWLRCAVPIGMAAGTAAGVATGVGEGAEVGLGVGAGMGMGMGVLRVSCATTDGGRGIARGASCPAGSVRSTRPADGGGSAGGAGFAGFAGLATGAAGAQTCGVSTAFCTAPDGAGRCVTTGFPGLALTPGCAGTFAGIGLSCISRGWLMARRSRPCRRSSECTPCSRFGSRTAGALSTVTGAATGASARTGLWPTAERSLCAMAAAATGRRSLTTSAATMVTARGSLRCR